MCAARYSRLDRGAAREPEAAVPHQPQLLAGPPGPVLAQRRAGVHARHVGRARDRRPRVRALARPARRPGPRTTLSLTYANEWEDYTVSEETLADPDQLGRAHLARLESGDRLGQRPALGDSRLDAGRSTTNNILDAKRGYVASLHLEHAGNFLSGDFNYYEISAEGRYFHLGRPTARWSPFASVAARSTARGQSEATRYPSTSAISWAARPTCAAGDVSTSRH